MSVRYDRGSLRDQGRFVVAGEGEQARSAHSPDTSRPINGAGGSVPRKLAGIGGASNATVSIRSTAIPSRPPVRSRASSLVTEVRSDTGLGSTCPSITTPDRHRLDCSRLFPPTANLVRLR